MFTIAPDDTVIDGGGFHTFEFTDFVGYDARFIKVRRNVPPKVNAS